MKEMVDFPKLNKLEELLELYGQHLASQGKTRMTVLAYMNPIKQFIGFLKEESISEPRMVEARHLEEFQRFLYDERDFKRA
ncbi:MAG: hypothetical protein JW902_07745, partial [Syntrophaceae bacterium]|nr:hypothetical protein [Syntrophaceae bacterium]